MIDPEKVWDDEFMEPPPPFDEAEIDEDELDRLENDFYTNTSGRRSPFGRLVSLDDSDESDESSAEG